MELLHVRTHGETGPEIVVLHGGPAAVGNAAPIARGLADAFRVLEPWQRRSGAVPLTVASHVADLDEVIAWHCNEPPALVGESWGAMLALAYAAAHPGRVRRLALIGCGTFGTAARARLGEILRERQEGSLEERLAELARSGAGAEEVQMELYRLTRTLYDYDPVPEPDEEMEEPFDMLGHQQTWDDMVARQREGTYPAAFAAISCPVVMLHGDYDPHPGEMIRDSLLPVIPQLEYQPFERCGHSPWTERWAREAFFEALHAWLGEPAP